MQKHLRAILISTSTLCLLSLGAERLAMQGMTVLLAWSPIAQAHAYRVKRVCEEISTKLGSKEVCKTTLDPDQPAPADDKKGDAKDAGKDAKKDNVKKADAKK